MQKQKAYIGISLDTKYNLLMDELFYVIGIVWKILWDFPQCQAARCAASIRFNLFVSQSDVCVDFEHFQAHAHTHTILLSGIKCDGTCGIV